MLREDSNIPARTLTTALLLLAVVMAAMAALSMPAPAAAKGARMDGAERALLREINRTRRSYGLHALKAHHRLQKSADYHCWDMLRANFFAHSSSNGTPFQKRVKRYTRKRRIGENLAYLPKEASGRAASRIVRMWMSSSGHRAALLSREFSRIGVARRIGTWGKLRVVVYTADFSSRR